MKALYFGAVVPPTAAWQTSAFSQGGNQFILDFLDALGQAGIEFEMVESYVPSPAWPRGPLWVAGARVSLPSGLSARLRPYLNVSGVKVLWLSTLAAYTILCWRPADRSRVVMAYNLSVPSGLFLRIAAWMGRKPLVGSINDIDVPGETVKDGPLQRLDWGLTRVILPRLDAAFVVTADIAELLAPRLPVMLLPGGMAPKREAALHGAPMDEELRATARGKFVVLLAGSLEAVNGVAEFVEAAARAPEGCEFWVAGRGTLAPAVEDAASRGLVRYLGYVSQDRLFRIQRTADLLVNLRIRTRIQSRFFFPGKFFEFLGSGTLTASTNVGSLFDEFADVIVPVLPDTTDGLLAAIVQARNLSADERLRIGEAARSRLLGRYSWKNLGRRAADFLHQQFPAETGAGSTTKIDTHSHA